MPEEKVIVNIGPGKDIEISTGKIAKLANGSCTLRLGDTTVLVAACSGAAKPGQDFFPLQVDYREKFSAAGRFPGGFIKREGRPTDKEILTCRMTDRPLRPLFPEGFFDEVQISGLLLSADGENEGDVLSILGASAALCLSDLPFMGPIGALRVGYIDGQFVANPTYTEMKKSSLELIYAGLPDKVIMIEGDAKELPESVLVAAMEFANEIVKKQVEAQLDLMKRAGRPKKTPDLHLVPAEITAGMVEIAGEKLEAACTVPGKEDRLKALDELKALIVEGLKPKYEAEMGEEDFNNTINMGFDKLVQKTIRTAILEKGFRPDGRGIEDIRPLTAEVGVLPVVHGTGLFTRGETQALVIATLGGPGDAQESDSIYNADTTRKFYLHYNFPNFSVGEVGRITGPGRREIGHGNLAERSVSKVVPADFPYVVRCVSEIMSSNGSTSMASVCGATLALMDAGVPIKAPVAGIAMGLIKDPETGKVAILTDIQGLEDFLGDMDFKVAGTEKGITAIQMDIKIKGIDEAILRQAIAQANVGRKHILGKMLECIPEVKPELSKYAPRIISFQIDPSKIGDVVGKQGKVINKIIEETGVKIDIEDDGTVCIAATGNDGQLERAKAIVLSIAKDPEVGDMFIAEVVRILPKVGAFCELAPGKDGLIHISRMSEKRIESVEEVLHIGDMVKVEIIKIGEKGIDLKLLEKMEG